MNRKELEFIVENLNYEHSNYDFNSGDPVYNDYLTEQAYTDVQIKNTQVHVILTKDRQTLVGYFTLSMRTQKMKLDDGTFYGQPVCLLGRMAVQKHLEGKGWGSLIIRKAIELCNNLSKDIGCKGILVETYKEDLIKNQFYQNRGFKFIKSEKTSSGTKYLLFFKLDN